MRILFVCSGNNKHFEIAPFIASQAESIKQKGVDVSVFKIKNKGIVGYLKAVWKLRKQLNSSQYDIIHAHYSFNGLVALLTFKNVPIVVSFMGSDTYGDFDKYGKRIFFSYINILISKIIQPFIDQIIVKSPNLANYIYAKKKLHIIPNGVNMERFKPIDRIIAINYLTLDSNKRYVLFLGDKKNERKNFSLADQAFKKIQVEADVELFTPYPVAYDKLKFYYNAADVIILSSYNEGSPNVIKEAMACNRPVVSTKVGDVKWLFGNEPGHFIADFDKNDFAEKLKDALAFSNIYEKTNGRKRIIDLKIDSESIANRIISIYNTVLNESSGQ